MQAVIEAKRLHCNRRGRWSEQQKTPALASRGDKRNFDYRHLILQDLMQGGKA